MYGLPFLFWVFTDGDLTAFLAPDEVSFVPDNSNGDPCHYNIIGVSKGKAPKFAKQWCKPPHIHFCDGENALNYTLEDLLALKLTIKNKE